MTDYTHTEAGTGLLLTDGNVRLNGMCPRAVGAAEGVDITCCGGHVMQEHNSLTESAKEIVGEVFESNKTGKFIVESVSENEKNRNTRFRVRFLETGHKTTAQKAQIKDGRIRDPYFPAVYGVGYVGDTTTTDGNGRLTRCYKRWNAMISRCYNESFRQFCDYGGRGISVCDRWKCFERYKKDVKRLPGYGDPGKITIDRIDNDGDYCPDNCRWATHSQQEANKRRKISTQKRFIAVSPSGERFEHYSQSEFARLHGLTLQNINGCLRGRQKTHKGWRFYYV